MVKPMIAVVDDDLAMREMLEGMLTDADYDVHCWPSGLTAFGDLVRAPPDLIILDLALGNDKEAGWQILTLLRAETRTAHIPVILLSANEQFLTHRKHILRTKKHARALAKPFDLDELLGLIAGLLRGAS